MTSFFDILKMPISLNFGKSIEQIMNDHKKTVEKLDSVDKLGKTDRLQITEDIEKALNDCDFKF